MKKILNIALLTLVTSTMAYADDTTQSVEPSIENIQKNEISSSSTVQSALDSQVSDIPQNIIPEKNVDVPYVETRTPIGFLQGQLQLTPEQVEAAKVILYKHYAQGREELSKILTPEQKSRLEYLETQEVKQYISL